MSGQRVGWFSKKCAKKYGYAIYSCPKSTHPSGTVAVTAVYNVDDELTESEKSGWTDDMQVGIIWDYLESFEGSHTIRKCSLK